MVRVCVIVLGLLFSLGPWYRNCEHVQPWQSRFVSLLVLKNGPRVRETT